MQTVLFVDDEPAFLESIGQALRKAPYRILGALGGLQGLELLASERVDVVVSDEMMPEMPGSEFLCRARAVHPDTVRLMLTGQASLSAAIRAVNEGEIFRFLKKPCSAAEIDAALREALRVKALRDESLRLLRFARSLKYGGEAGSIQQGYDLDVDGTDVDTLIAEIQSELAGPEELRIAERPGVRNYR